VKELLLLNPMPPHPLKYMNSVIYRSIFFFNQFKLINRIGHQYFLTKKHYKTICKENLKYKRLITSLYVDVGYLLLKQPETMNTVYHFAHAAAAYDWDKWAEQLHNISVPTTIMQGLDDKVFSLKAAKYLHSLIPSSNLVEVENCGHAMVFDQHKQVSHFLLSRFEDLDT